MKSSHSIKNSIFPASKSRRLTLFSCAALAAFTQSLHAATTLLNNPGATSTGASNLYDLAFSTGSTAYTLGAISLAPVLVRFSEAEFSFSSESPTGSLTVSLYAANTATHSRTGSALASETFSDVQYASVYSGGGFKRLTQSA